MKVSFKFDLINGYNSLKKEFIEQIEKAKISIIMVTPTLIPEFLSTIAETAFNNKKTQYTLLSKIDKAVYGAIIEKLLLFRNIQVRESPINLGFFSILRDTKEVLFVTESEEEDNILGYKTDHPRFIKLQTQIINPVFIFLLWEGIPSYQQDVIDVPPERKIKLASGGQIGKFYHLFAIKNKEINSQSELKKLLQEKGVLRSRRFLIKFELPVSERVSRLLTIFRLHGIVKIRGIDELSIERIDEKRYYVWQIYLVLILTSFCALLCLGLIAKRRRRLINEKKEL